MKQGFQPLEPAVLGTRDTVDVTENQAFEVLLQTRTIWREPPAGIFIANWKAIMPFQMVSNILARRAKPRCRALGSNARSKLQPCQTRIKPVFGHQLVMCTFGDNAAFLQHHDPVGFFDCRQTVRDDQRRAVLR